MAKLVFDIETSALPLEHFDEAQQEYLFRECEKIADESARKNALDATSEIANDEPSRH